MDESNRASTNLDHLDRVIMMDQTSTKSDPMASPNVQQQPAEVKSPRLPSPELTAESMAREIFACKSIDSSIWCKQCLQLLPARKSSSLLVHCIDAHQIGGYKCVKCEFKSTDRRVATQHFSTDHISSTTDSRIKYLAAFTSDEMCNSLKMCFGVDEIRKEAGGEKLEEEARPKSEEGEFKRPFSPPPITQPARTLNRSPPALRTVENGSQGIEDAACSPPKRIKIDSDQPSATAIIIARDSLPISAGAGSPLDSRVRLASGDDHGSSSTSIAPQHHHHQPTNSSWPESIWPTPNIDAFWTEISRSGIELICTDCNQRFTTNIKTTAMKHVMHHLQLGYYRCRIEECKTYFMTKDAMEMHVRGHFPDLISELIDAFYEDSMMTHELIIAEKMRSCFKILGIDTNIDQASVSNGLPAAGTPAQWSTEYFERAPTPPASTAITRPRIFGDILKEIRTNNIVAGRVHCSRCDWNVGALQTNRIIGHACCHASIRAYTCLKCGFGYWYQGSADEHVRRNHPELKVIRKWSKFIGYDEEHRATIDTSLRQCFLAGNDSLLYPMSRVD